jgi:hypothetical protein
MIEEEITSSLITAGIIYLFTRLLLIARMFASEHELLCLFVP